MKIQDFVQLFVRDITIDVFEHGLVDRSPKADPGGLTNFGISARAHPTVDIANLTLEGAIEIYMNDYVQPVFTTLGVELTDDYDLLDGVNSVRLSAALLVLDITIRSGLSRGIKSLQYGLGVAVDGKFGPKSKAALNNIEDLEVLIEVLGRSMAAYTSFLITLPNWQQNDMGWMTRNYRLIAYINQFA